jgi:hypothetical protein
VFQTCLIAFPDFKSKPKGAQISRIKKAIEKVLKEHLETERVDEIGGWEHLMPGWKKADSLSLYEPGRGIRIEYRREDDTHSKWSVSVESTDQIHDQMPILFPRVPYIPE